MRLVGYARVSDKEQVKKGFSIEAQEETIRAWCSENDHDLVKMFVEPGRSGSKRAKDARPTFQAAVEFTLAGGSEGIVVKWMDRFSRNTEDFLRVRSELFQANKQLISISEPLLNGDPSDPIARYISTAIMNAYQLQAELSGLKAAQGRERRAKLGKYPGSVPIGYKRVDREAVPDPDRAEMIAQSFFNFATEPYTLDTWTEEARRRGYTTRRNKPISKGQWARIFRNPFYTGRYTWKDIEYVGDYEAIVTVEIFEAVQEILDARGPEEAGRKHFWLLSGLLWSDVHHKVMTGAMVKGAYTYYRASGAGAPEHNVKADEIERQVIKYLDRIEWTGEPLTLSENLRLAFSVAFDMGQIYPHLITPRERREFLRMIFFKRGIRVAAGGHITGADLLPGFILVT